VRALCDVSWEVGRIESRPQSQPQARPALEPDRPFQVGLYQFGIILSTLN